MPISWSIVPLIHAGIFGLLAVALRLLMAYRRSRGIPLFLDTADSPRGFAARCFYVWLPLADLGFLVFYASTGNAGPVLWSAEAVRWSGTALLVLALAWVVGAQMAMGADWRMGVDEGHEGKLLTSGLFAYSRHPVYTGIRLTLAAQLLVIGSWPAVCLWLAGELLVQLQARFEEEAMVLRHGASYAGYCAKVRRWL